MNITFPPNPNTGDTFTAENGVIYTYDGTKWVAVGTGGGTVPISTGNIGFSGDAIYDLNGMVIENADLTHGATAAIIIPANGSTSPVQVNNTYGDITLGTGNNASITAIYTFGKTGNITLPSNSSNINYANGVSILSGLGGGGNYGNSNVATFLASFGSNVISTTGNITAGFVKGDGSQLTNLPAGNYSNSNVVALLASFGSNSISTSGNVTATNFVGNIPAADGNGSVQLNVNGHLGAAAGFNYSGNTLYSHTASFSGEPDSGINGLYTGVPGFTILGSSVMTQVTGNVIGYSQTNFQNISDSPVASGDYIITSDNGNDSTHFLDLGITSSTWDGAQENSLGNALGPGDGYLYVQDGNLALAVKDGIDQHVWYFDNVGNTTVPNGIQTPTTGFPFTSNIANITTGDTTVIVTLTDNVFGSPVTGQVTISGVVGTTEANGTWYFEAVESADLQLYYDAELANPVDGTTWTAYISGGLAVAPGYSNLSITGGNVSIVTNAGNTWTFDDLGGTIFPTLSVQRGDNPGGTISGQTLLFGDGNQEAIISTPDGVPGNEYSQRLVINPGAGNNYGEGGDIYLWAGRGGDGSGSGGDIKIRGGQGGANTSGGNGGDGGYIRMEAGQAADTGGNAGYIEITGGVAGYGTPGIAGGQVTITGGQGQNGDGGSTNITGGYGGTGYNGGDVNITGGGTSNGLASYGNINLYAGISGWVFNNNGNLTLPNGDNITNGGWYGTPSSTVSLNAFSPDGNTVSIQAQGNTSSIVLETVDNANALINNWTFDSNGAITLPPALGPGSSAGLIRTANAYPTLLAYGSNGHGGPELDWTNSDDPIVDFGNASILRNTMYLNGDGLYIGINENDVANVFSGNWQFDTNGNLNTPQGGYIGAAGVKGDGTMLTGGKGNIASLTSFYANVDALNYSSCVTANPDGTLNITTYGDGTGQLGQWQFSETNLTVPGDGIIGTPIATGGAGGNSITIQAGSSDTFASAPGGNLNLVGGYGSFGDGYGPAGGNVNIASGGSYDSHPGNVNISTGNNTWAFDYTGELVLATVTNESAKFVGTRKVVGGLGLASPYSVSLAPGGTPTLTYVSQSGTNSVKVTFAVQSSGSGFQWEQFDVVAVPSQEVSGAVNFVVSNRVKGNSTISDTVVTAAMSGSQIQISLTLDVAQNSGGTASFDAVEFGLMVD